MLINPYKIIQPIQINKKIKNIDFKLMLVWWTINNINMIDVVPLLKLNFGSNPKLVLSLTMHIFCLAGFLFFFFGFGIFILPVLILIYNIRSLNYSTVISTILSGNLFFFFFYSLTWWEGIVCISLFHECFWRTVSDSEVLLSICENIKMNPKTHVGCGLWGILWMIWKNTEVNA